MSNSSDNQLGKLRPSIVALIESERRGFSACELCSKELNGNFDLHHTKYEGATYKDLMVVCHKCNTQQENRFLD